MANYVLFKEYDYSGRFADAQMLGLFTTFDKANNYINSLPEFVQDKVCFVAGTHCPSQTIYVKDNHGNDVKLTLTMVEENPITRLSPIREQLKEEDTILDLLKATDEAGDNLTCNDDEQITVWVRDIAKTEIFLKFSCWGISLLEDGTWQYEDQLYSNEDGYD